MSSMRRTREVVAILAMLVAVPAAAGGTLCFLPAQTCIDGVSFEPADVERRAVWIDSEQQRVAVLAVAAGQHSIDPDAPRPEIRLRIGTRRLSRGARAIDFTLRDARGRAWAWSLPGRAASPVIAAPVGVYTLEVTAPQARTRSVSGLRLEGRRSIDAGLIDLEPKLTATGTVLDPLGVPIAGASVFDAAGAQLTSTEGDGTFVIEPLADELPPRFTIRVKGFASREVAVRDRRESLDAGSIVLDRGATLTVTVAFPETPASSRPSGVRVALYRDTHEREFVERRELGDGGAVAFGGVATGRYIVVAEGSGALQKYGEFLDVKEPVDISHTLAIEPVSLEGYAWYGVQPLAGTTITIIAPGEVWRAEQVIGDGGEFGGTLWQRGRFAAMLRGGALRTHFVDDTTIAASEAAWDIVVPDRKLAGVVSDARSTAPVGGAKVVYETIGTRMRLSSYVMADGAGRFEITGLPEGAVKVYAIAAGYLPSAAVEIGVRGNDPSREVTLALDAGSLVRVRVVDERQLPIAGATVIDGVDPTGTLALARPVTAANGEVTLSVLAGTPKRIYVIPREGSFAAAVVRAEDGADRPVTITVPSATGSLVVNARTDGDDAIPRLHFLIRYNGDVLPQAFWTLLQHTQGFNLVTDDGGVARHPRLPPGMYELWPYGPQAEGRSIYMNPSVLAPLARVGVNAGDEQVVTLTFASRE